MKRLLPKRKMSWVIWIWNIIFLIWIIGGISSRTSKDCPPADSLCTDASDVGTGIGVALIFGLWFLGFIVLALIFLMTRPRNRICPACGSDVKKGLTACKNCGHNFVAPAVSSPVPPPAAVEPFAPPVAAVTTSAPPHVEHDA